MPWNLTETALKETRRNNSRNAARKRCSAQPHPSKTLAKQIGKSEAELEGVWQQGIYETRTCSDKKILFLSALFIRKASMIYHVSFC